jgi:hypothetical protein
MAVLTPAVTGASVAPSTLAAAPDAANSLPPGSRLLSHVCKVIGGDSTYEAVHCADLYTNGQVITAGNEIICQHAQPPNGIVACKSLVESVEVAVRFPDGTGQHSNPFAGICGANLGHSPCRDARVDNYVSVTLDDEQDSSGCTAWAVTGDPTFAGGDPDSVQVPDGNVYSGPDLGTPHETVPCQPGILT